MDRARARSTRSRSSHETLEKEAGGRANLDREELIEALKKDAHAAYDRREAEVGEEVMRELERRVLLSVLDRKWREHLYEMDYLREGIYLRAYSQRDPLVEYQREGFDMFAAMMDGIKEEAVGFLFNLEVQVEDGGRGRGRGRGARSTRADAPGGRRPPSARRAAARTARRRRSGPRASRRPQPPQNLSYSAPDRGTARSRSRGGTVTNADDPYADVGRNALCPCGSGKKYKRCHGAPGGPTGLTARASQRLGRTPRRALHSDASRVRRAARTGRRRRGSAGRSGACTLTSTTSRRDEARVHAAHLRA